MISPLLWQSVPFGDPDAYFDFLRSHESWHFELAKATKTRFQLLDDLRENLQPHQTMHDALALAFGITRVADLTSFDLSDEQSWLGWHTLNAQDHERFRIASGIN
jgi:hypothetical protein